MQRLVTRFHLLLLTVTLAITGVGVARIPADFVFLAYWQGNGADWLWPREAIFVAPVLQLLLLATFFGLARCLTPNHYAKSQHILDPALTMLMSVVAATQLGLLLAGISSDLDFIRVTGFGLGVVLLLLGAVLFEAERHTYAGLRMPWPIPSDRAWQVVHRTTGVAYASAGAGLLLLAWLNPGIGVLVPTFAAALALPVILATVITLVFRTH